MFLHSVLLLLFLFHCSVVFPWPKHTLTGEEWRSHMPSSDTAVKLGWPRASSSFKKKFISIFGLDFRRPRINNSVCLQFSVSSFTFIVWNNVASTFHRIPFSVEIPFFVSLLFARMIIIKKLPNRWNAAFSNVTQVLNLQRNLLPYASLYVAFEFSEVWGVCLRSIRLGTVKVETCWKDEKSAEPPLNAWAILFRFTHLFGSKGSHTHTHTHTHINAQPYIKFGEAIVV